MSKQQRRDRARERRLRRGAAEGECPLPGPRGRVVRSVPEPVPMSPGQHAALHGLQNGPVTFLIGPAGTGKTHIAVAYALHLLQRGEVEKVVVTRPAVTAGEELGFLPGGLMEKMHPYLLPIWDVLDKLVGWEAVQRMLASGVLEVAPVGFLQGRTLEAAFVVVDEAQNCTMKQVRLVLSRLGRGSQMALVGDPAQVNIEGSGLRDAADRLGGVDGVLVVELTEADIVRHPLIGRMLEALGEE